MNRKSKNEKDKYSKITPGAGQDKQNMNKNNRNKTSSPTKSNSNNIKKNSQTPQSQSPIKKNSINKTQKDVGKKDSLKKGGIVRKQAVELEVLNDASDLKKPEKDARSSIHRENNSLIIKKKKVTVNPYDQKNLQVGKTKTGNIIPKSTTQRLIDDPHFKSMKEGNEIMINSLKEMLYVSIEKKMDVTSYILNSGNYDSRNRTVPWYIILPNGKCKRFWDFFVTFFLLYSLIIVPIDVSWNVECFTTDAGGFISFTYSICTSLFFIDIFLNFFTAVLNEKNQYIYDLQAISTHYLTNNFFFDLLAALPFDKFKAFRMSDCFQPYIAPSKIYLSFVLVRFFKLGKYIAVVEDLLSKYITIIRLTKIFLTMLYLSHLIGNLFSGNSPNVTSVIFQACNSYKTIETSQACLKKLMIENFSSIYFYSVFLGMYLLTGNEPTVSQHWERVFVIIVLITALGLNASIFGNVAVIISKMSVGLDPFVQEKIDIMKEYMNFMKFDQETIEKIEGYHVNIWMKQRNMMYPDGFFSNMSSALHKLILLDQWRKSFFEISHFLPRISPEFFGDILRLLKPKIFMRDDVIITEGESTDGAVYFISRNGSCSVKIGGEWVTNMILGDFFGEIAIFLRSKRRTATITSLRDSDFLSIDGKDFESLLQDYPNDYEKIKNAAKDRLLSNIKLYPSKLFAKLVPKNDLKDYLLRKSIYLNDEEEDRVFQAVEESLTVNLEKILPKLEMCNQMLTNARNNLTNLNKLVRERENSAELNLENI